MHLIAGVIALLLCGSGDRVVLVAFDGKINEPFAVDFDASGNMFIAEMSGGRIRKLDAKGVLTTVDGTGDKARLNGPHHLVVGPGGDVFVADTWNNRVRKIDGKTGEVTTFAGTGEKGFSGDGGPAAQAKFGGLYCLSFGPKGATLYLADLDNRRIRAIDMKTGTVSTVAGNGAKGVPKDGADAVSAPLVDPRAVAVDSKGNVYILERGGHALRVVDAAGQIRTVAGSGRKGFSGNGGPALKAELNGPKHLMADLEDNILIADAENHVIRRYLPREGKIVLVAGTGKKGSAGVGGPPDKVELNRPHGIYVHPSGALYISDTENHRILKIER